MAIFMLRSFTHDFFQIHFKDFLKVLLNFEAKLKPYADFLKV
jgi:hypothetical protein